MMRYGVGAFIVSVTFLSGASAEPISGSRIFSGPWEIQAYTHDETGLFSYCAASAFYQHNNTQLYFSLYRDYTMTIAVQDFSGRFPENAEFPVTLRVDRRQPFFGTAYTTDSQWAFVTLTQMDRALDAMRRGQILVVEGLYGNLSYALNGTFRALENTYNCAANYFNFQTAPSSQTNSAVTNGWQPTRNQERRMLQLSAAIAADLGQAGIVYREDSGPVATWDAKDGSMWVGTAIGRLEGSSISLAQEFSLDMGNLAAWCNGALATVSNNHIIEGAQTTESSTQCLSNTGALEFQTHIIRQIINEELVEVVIYLDGQSVSNVDSSSGNGNNLGLSIAALSASYLLE